MEAFLRCVSLYLPTAVNTTGYTVLLEGDNLHGKDWTARIEATEMHQIGAYGEGQ
jgi:hypothetical protein